MDAAISAMYTNPYLAPIAPMVQIAWETEQASGQPMTRGLIEKIGLGLGLGLYMKGDEEIERTRIESGSRFNGWW